MTSIIRDLANDRAEYRLLMAYAAACGTSLYGSDFEANCELVLAEYRELPEERTYGVEVSI